MKSVTTLLMLCGSLCFGVTSSANADFMVDSWRLSAGVTTGPFPMLDSDFNVVVVNPLNTSLLAFLDNSTAQSTHQFQWNATSGSFSSTAHLEAQGGSTIGVASDNLVRIHTTTEVLLTVDAQWTFAMPGGDRETLLQVIVGLNPPSSAFSWSRSRFADIQNGPPSNTFSIQDSVLIPAGGNYYFRSIFDFRSFSGSPSQKSIGDGYVNFTLTSIPEPEMVGALVIGALTLARGRRYRFGQIR